MHLSVLAWEIDEAAAKAGKGQKWRSSFGRSFSQLLSQEPFAERLEMEAIRVGPSHVDWWYASTSSITEIFTKRPAAPSESQRWW